MKGRKFIPLDKKGLQYLATCARSKVPTSDEKRVNDEQFGEPDRFLTFLAA